MVPVFIEGVCNELFDISYAESCGSGSMAWEALNKGHAREGGHP